MLETEYRNQVVVPARQPMQPGGPVRQRCSYSVPNPHRLLKNSNTGSGRTGSLAESIPGFLKSLQIRPLGSCLVPSNEPSKSDF